ncbi:helical backbone metal receptor [Christiangramia sp. SM2212]|uniref:Helical backbone metal receptor n=1 Tax=Christiangramia sediminicola TaxID=3073267 RepID=A0ABU1EML7_9FLAO|nr:helical backbone metal receptor [Christiangramia sp. SM2212]MDR5589625.1 helical backbone metal receptor [Christiangramia sp. SM2212]
MEIQDQLGRNLKIETAPKRIISLVPSQTELLVDLGLEESIIGITHFCVHPFHLRDTKTTLGGTKKVIFRKVRELEPDIILCNKEENTKEMVEELEKIAPVHISDVANLSDVYDLMQQYGKIFNCSELAETMVNSIKKKIDHLAEMAEGSEKRKVAYFIWNNPLMVVGRGTFINEMLELNNFENVFEEKRYPETNAEELIEKDIDICMLSSEPFPFEEKHIPEFNKYSSEVLIVDGEYFSWYGSRLLKALDYFKQFHL